MIGIVIAAHGNLASEIVSTAESILGKQEYFEAVSVKVGESADNLKNKLDSVLTMTTVDGLLILSDIFGSSFSTSCMYFAENKKHVAVVTGINLPMLLKVLTHRNSVDLDELILLACKGGREGILDACGWLNKEKRVSISL